MGRSLPFTEKTQRPMPGWFVVLCAVQYLGPWTSGRAIADDLGWSVKQVGPHLSRLNYRGLVTATTQARDGQIVHVHAVTTTGLNLVRDAMFDVARVFTRTTDSLLSYEGRREVTS